MSSSSAPTGLRFIDKVAIVTGGCDGIGRGIAETLASHGGKVAVFDINDEMGKELKAGEVGEMFYVHCDMRNEEEIQAAIATTISKFGHLDCLVNNAGVFWGPQTVDEMTVKGFRDLIELDLVSYFAASKFALPFLRKTKGCIVNISSISASTTQRHSVDYCAAKGGVTALTKALAIDESKNGVRVNAIAPGAILTRLMEKACSTQEIQDGVTSLTYLNRFATPEEIGLACLFLATDANYCTGIELKVMGGMDIGFGFKKGNSPYV